ncbi:DNA helicase [Maritalea myrionectae]|uniref:DNA helicase n=1 Tax=Maritalea myrionectae TaxID=454601 RepID=A0A2R4MEH2_9HYPH|nr:DnaB-like helicase C-terminal domain-containing protein [Maritalea myrionectae]AVX04314.1 DNA helicase [Maritalea myrionectae]
MTAALAHSADHNESTLEFNIIGSFIMSPESLMTYADQIDAEWFEDEACATLWTIMANQAREGLVFSWSSLLAEFEDHMEDRKLASKMLAHIAAMAIPVGLINGSIDYLKKRWMRRSLREIASEIQVNANNPQYRPKDAVTDAIAALDRVQSSSTSARALTLGAANTKLAKKMEDPEAAAGASTGLKALDEKVNAFARGELFVLAGRPGMGKSAFALSTLRNTAKLGHGVLFFSFEMPETEVSARMVSDELYGQDRDAFAPSFSLINKGRLSPDNKARVISKFEETEELPFIIEPSPRLTMAEVTARSREKKAALQSRGIELEVICIDHLDHVEPTGRYRGNKVEEVAEVSNAARALAKELNCCVLLLSQLNRSVESRDDKRPRMSDLRNSGALEQDAHVVMFVYRDYQYLKDDPTAEEDALAAKNDLDLLIKKNRNGETGDIKFHVSIAHNAVRDRYGSA